MYPHSRQSLPKGAPTRTFLSQAFQQPCWEGIASIYSTLGGWEKQSALHVLWWLAHKAKSQPYTTRLQKIFARVKERYGERKDSARLTNLRLSICLQTHRSHTWHSHAWGPKLQKQSIPCHAWRRLSPALLGCLKAFNQISQHSEIIPGFPSPSEFVLAQNLAKSFFDQYEDSHAWALSKNRNLFHITNNFHTAHHLTRNAQYQLQNASQL